MPVHEFVQPINRTGETGSSCRAMPSLKLELILWDSPHNCKDVMDGERLFRKDRQEGRGEGCTLLRGGGGGRQLKKVQDPAIGEVSVPGSPSVPESEERANKGDIVVGTCFRQSD